MSNLWVRRADESDIPILSMLAEEFMPQEATREKRKEILRHILKNPDYELLVAELEGKIAGFIDQWIIHDFAHGAKLSYIQNLYVTSKHRRKGVGSRLLGEIMKSAKKKGVLEIHVVTEFGNRSTINLYRKYGLLRESLQLEREFG
ncbi:MAG: GNAT family N-acetyltransferase [Candidatus Bathyarchaeota archaeon]|nr:GNAT family N-acetyltransferase [Candidatus Bathyarchaeota archaeon]